MADLARRRLLSAAAGVLGLGVVGACTRGPDQQTPAASVGQKPGGYLAGTHLASGPAIPDITLTDTENKPFRLAHDVATPVTLLFFGYTHCPDICPGILADLASARQRAEARVREQTTVVLVSTDPPRDTPAVMKRYLSRIDETFIGLTGDLDVIKKAGQELGITMEQTTQLPSGGYEIEHGTQVFGVGGNGRVQVLWTQGTSVADYKSDLATLVDRQPQ